MYYNFLADTINPYNNLGIPHLVNLKLNAVSGRAMTTFRFRPARCINIFCSTMPNRSHQHFKPWKATQHGYSLAQKFKFNWLEVVLLYSANKIQKHVWEVQFVLKMFFSKKYFYSHDNNRRCRIYFNKKKIQASWTITSHWIFKLV